MTPQAMHMEIPGRAQTAFSHSFQVGRCGPAMFLTATFSSPFSAIVYIFAVHRKVVLALLVLFRPLVIVL